MVTSADSVLKWRDSKGLGGNVAASYAITDTTKAALRYSYTSLRGGAMSDYDLTNMYPQGGVFSETTKMTGSYQTYAIDFSHLLSDRLSAIAGYEYKNLKLNPANAYQVNVDHDKGAYEANYIPGASQNTNVKMHGVNLGFDYKITSDVIRYGVTATVFVPVFYESRQYNWGYQNDSWDWQANKTGLNASKNLGYSVKLYNQHKLSENRDLWLNTYVAIESVRITKARETDKQNNVQSYGGQINYARLNKVSLGVGLSF